MPHDLSSYKDQIDTWVAEQLLKKGEAEIIAATRNGDAHSGVRKPVFAALEQTVEVRRRDRERTKHAK